MCKHISFARHLLLSLATMYDDCFDDDDCLMDDSQSNVVDDRPFRDDINFDDDDFPLRDETNFDDDDDSPFRDDSEFDDDYSPFMDESQSNVDDPHESRPTRHMHHPSTRIELSDIPESSQMPPPSYIPPFGPPSVLSPDIVAQLTHAELAHNPEFMQLYNRVELLRSTVELYRKRRIDAENEARVRALGQTKERVLEWRSGVDA